MVEMQKLHFYCPLKTVTKPSPSKLPKCRDLPRFTVFFLQVGLLLEAYQQKLLLQSQSDLLRLKQDLWPGMRFHFFQWSLTVSSQQDNCSCLPDAFHSLRDNVICSSCFQALSQHTDSQGIPFSVKSSWSYGSLVKLRRSPMVKKFAVAFLNAVVSDPVCTVRRLCNNPVARLTADEEVL